MLYQSVLTLLRFLAILFSLSYVLDNFLDEMDRLAKEKTHKEINSYYFMEAIIFDVILDIIIRDGLLAIFSLVFVFIWLRINTGSWFLSAVGILVSSAITQVTVLHNFFLAMCLIQLVRL